MNFGYRGLLFLIFCLFEFGFSCNKKYWNKENVEAAMRYYDHLILKTDADSIALLYMPNGELGNIAVGRDSIRNFLNRFENFKVIYQTTTVDSITIKNDTAMLNGIYHQKVIVPAGDTISVKGEYNAKWIWLKDGGWHIRRMETHPAS
jgi:SnoaL-like domain